MSAFTKDEEEKNEKKTFVIKLRKRDFSFYYYNNTLRFELCPYILLTKTVLGGGLLKKNIINITHKKILRPAEYYSARNEKCH